MAASPSARTLGLLRKEGYMAGTVERRLPRGFTTVDLFGCIDILAVRPGSPVLGVQATSQSNTSARFKKSIAVPQLRIWLEAGCVFEVWGWSLRGAAGIRKRWGVTRRAVLMSDLPVLEVTDET